MAMSNQERLKEYDSEPVKYCSRCYSLKIKYEESVDFECCADCGSSDIAETTIDEWEKKYEKRYGKKFVAKNNDPKKSFIFSVPIQKLKERVYNNPAWREIVLALYPRFPGGLSKADSVILLFDKLVKENRLDDLRLLLLNKY